MKLRILRSSASCAFVLLSCLPSSALASGVRIVDATGLRNFPDIQSAIHAAVDGDVLLVGAGSYPAFTLDGQNLSIFGVPAGGAVSITGTITIRNIVGACLVEGLSSSSLNAANCPGFVTLEGCSFQGANGTLGSSPGSGGEIQGCAAVVLSACTFQGGIGSYMPGPYAQNGAIGLSSSASSIAAYGSSFGGGRGGDHDENTGNGGAGLRAAGSWLYAAGCSIQGGSSGNPFGGQPAICCGDGGNGLEINPTSQAHLLEDNCGGGGSGMCFSCPGAGGLPIWNQGTLDVLPGSARRIVLAPLSVDRAPWSVSASGIAGDQLFLERGFAPVFQYVASLSGVCTAVLPPFTQVTPAGMLPASGSLHLTLRQRLLQDGQIARVNYLQLRVLESGGAGVLGNPQHVLSLNWDSPPDCNGNGINDYAEVIAGVTPDLDHDLKPDGCP